MYTIKIYDIDSINEIARKIYYHFEINQSCTIWGIEAYQDAAVPKGQLIVDEIRRIYAEENMRRQGTKIIRVRKYVENSVGGELAHKIFKWQMNKIDNDVRYTIWRIQ